MIGYNDFISCLKTGLSVSNEEMSRFYNAFSGLRQESDALYADMQEFNEQVLAAKKARKIKKTKNPKKIQSNADVVKWKKQNRQKHKLQMQMIL